MVRPMRHVRGRTGAAREAGPRPGVRQQGAQATATALVTGGSSGIGEALAAELADRGYGLLLVSENAPELRRVRRRLQRPGGPPVRIRVTDLSRPEAPAELYAFCRRQGLEVEVLVNAAGDYLVAERELGEEAAVPASLTLHVLAPTRLCFLFGPQMLQRGRGFILNISSISALFCDPASMSYGAAKAYIRAFSRALHCDWRARGVSVSCALPGGVRTGLFQSSGVFVPPLVGRHLLSPEACARLCLRALFRRRREVIPGWSGKLQAALFRLIARPAFYDAVKGAYQSMRERRGP
jgi:short-subunit dehydrogenase